MKEIIAIPFRILIQKKMTLTALVISYSLFLIGFYVVSESSALDYKTHLYASLALFASVIVCQPALSVVIWIYIREKASIKKAGITGGILSTLIYLVSLFFLLIATELVIILLAHFRFFDTSPYGVLTNPQAVRDSFFLKTTVQKLVIDISALYISLVLIWFLALSTQFFLTRKARETHRD